MYCQQRLFAFLYAVLGAISNTTQESPPSSPNDATSGNAYLASCSSVLTSTSELVTIAPIRGPEGPGSKPTFRLSLTIANVGEQPIDLDQCETVMEQLVFKIPENSIHDPLANVRFLVPPQLEKAALQVYRVKRRLWQRKSQSEADKVEAEKVPQANSPAQGYHGILEYIISKMEHGMSRLKRNEKNAPSALLPPVPNKRQPPVQRDLYSLGPTCEDQICEGDDWEKICITSHIPETKKDQCIMCYPRKHMALVQNYCQQQKYRELDIFYKTCALLGASIMGATLLYLLREIYRRLRMRYQFLQNICRRSQLSGSTTTKSGLSSLLPGIPKAWREPRQARNSTADDAENPTPSNTIIQQRFRRLGPFAKETRKRVQDIFDLESFEGYQNEPELGTKIPVLPRARNASLRKHVTGSRSRTNSYSDGNAGPGGNVMQHTKTFSKP
ncbi:hypothetical protein BO78DRAFT_459681 [Aspergillus sclerotiicarbonarius CBS 121057]|uniref:Integral membrane protein n=1 Tax=Aspergillus sclerotiicarbonarius (strain CBS 121057 / IBT 28362) TaxID=1448318 RepID=A0A319EP81_ASPSB|nr:hypothetical protein BO78DRAFT_459681 [Aspergillus sclerotiicarbonarius CBS 121057]